jgi:hypothetical protein
MQERLPYMRRRRIDETHMQAVPARQASREFDASGSAAAYDHFWPIFPALQLGRLGRDCAFEVQGWPLRG